MPSEPIVIEGASRGGEVRPVRKAYRYRIYPTEEQAAAMSRTIGCCRLVYNHFLQERIDAYERTQETLRRPVLSRDGSPVRDERGQMVIQEVENDRYDPSAEPLSYYDTSKALKAFKAERVGEDGKPFLKEADSVALCYALRHLDSAYQNFFRRVRSGGAPGFPRFKARSAGGSYTTAGKGVRVTPPAAGERLGSIRLPKVGDVPARLHRFATGEIVNVTVSRGSDGRWFASVNVKDAPQATLEPDGRAIAVATGVRPRAVTSDGTVYEGESRLKAIEERLARAKRVLSRRQGARKGEKRSKRYEKQARKVARLQSRLKDQRQADAHELSRELVDLAGTLYIREMATSEMLRKGRSGLPRKAERRVSAIVADANLSELNRQIIYKAQWAGRGLVVVPGDYPTAQTCSACGHKNTLLLRDLRPEWTCPVCGAVHDRKLNGALNILEAAQDILAAAPVGLAEPSAVTRNRREPVAGAPDDGASRGGDGA